MASAESLVERAPSAIETVDETIMNLAREDVIFHLIRDFVEDVGSTPVAAVNLVEFQGADAAEVDADLVRGVALAVPIDALTRAPRVSTRLLLAAIVAVQRRAE